MQGFLKCRRLHGRRQELHLHTQLHDRDATRHPTHRHSNSAHSSWHPFYLTASASGTPLAPIKQYIEQHKRPD